MLSKFIYDITYDLKICGMKRKGAKKKTILVTKASGEMAPFSSEKLMSSLLRAGASDEIATQITNDMKGKLYEGISTRKIYGRAFSLLRKTSSPAAAKYHLKRGIMELGPSGYPFERFVAEILRWQGYDTKVGEIVKGKCVNHEIDVIAEKAEHHFMVECKYHNQQGTVCDVKIPLYIQARFKDVEAEWKLLPGHGTKFHQGWVVTNTRFTLDAIQYGTCAGLKLIGWDYPDGDSLRSQIDKSGLYPITCMNTLTRMEKQRLLDNNIVLSKEICTDPSVLTRLGIDKSKIKAVLNESAQLCMLMSSRLSSGRK